MLGWNAKSNGLCKWQGNGRVACSPAPRTPLEHLSRGDELGDVEAGLASGGESPIDLHASRRKAERQVWARILHDATGLEQQSRDQFSYVRVGVRRVHGTGMLEGGTKSRPSFTGMAGLRPEFGHSLNSALSPKADVE